MPPAPRLLAAALALLTVGGLGVAARCTSAAQARCSLATLTGNGPRLDVPYAVTRPELVERMLDLAKVGPGTRLLDLGTGDGRIARAAARRGAAAEGIDIDPVLVAEAQATAAREGLSARFRVADLFATPLAGRDAVTMFLLPQVNLRLRPRLLAELAPGARIVSHAFTMGDWAPDGEANVGGARAYIWIVPARVGGDWRLADGRRLRLVQSFQQVSGTLAEGARTLPVTGRLAGRALRLLADGRVLDAQVSGDRLDGRGWFAARRAGPSRP
jgi:SAM-dependent methyltransferase